MLTKSCRVCGVPGTRSGLCPTHTKQQNNRQARGYDKVYTQNRAELVKTVRAYDLPCWLCGKRFLPGERVTADHRVPLAHGGDSSLRNLAPAHESCNKSRGSGPNRRI